MLLPVGADNFKKIIENETVDFIDKSLFIKDIFDDSATEVAVITRPRRFGKTLAMSMLHHFLATEIGGDSTAGLFDNLKIAQCDQKYMQHHGKYPVVFISFKNIKASSFDKAYGALEVLVANTYREHNYLLESSRLTKAEKKSFEIILEKKAKFNDIEAALSDLTYYLHRHYGVKPWLLIDEYDTPIQAAYVNNLEPDQAKGLPKEDKTRVNYYRNMMNLIRSLLGDALKSNPYLHRAVITGILRVAKESLFSGLNNLKVYSMLSKKYSEHFGFTEQEVTDILNQADLTDKAEAIKQWYNGYQVGPTVVYNPWSIANCIQGEGEMQTYWVNTSKNQLIKELLKKSSPAFKEQLEKMLKQDKSDYELIDENVVFGYLNSDETALWSLFLMSGYLTPRSMRQTDRGVECELAIPNREVGSLYRQIIEQWLANGQGLRWYDAFINSLLTGKMVLFKDGLKEIMEQIASYHDLSRRPENFYHGLILGLIVSLHKKGYEVTSNHESGYGRYDIMLIPDDKTKLGIIIELKNCKSNPKNNNEDQNLIKHAQEALKQIDEKKYPERLKQHGISEILKIGIGFCVKEFELVSERSQT